jgi:hypothetical protein
VSKPIYSQVAIVFLASSSTVGLGSQRVKILFYDTLTPKFMQQMMHTNKNPENYG